MTPSGIEPATFRFVAQYLNDCATAVPTLCHRGPHSVPPRSPLYFSAIHHISQVRSPMPPLFLSSLLANLLVSLRPFCCSYLSNTPAQTLPVFKQEYPHLRSTIKVYSQCATNRDSIHYHSTLRERTTTQKVQHIPHRPNNKAVIASLSSHRPHSRDKYTRHFHQ